MKCIECGQRFDLKETAEHFPQYYEFPYNYGQGEHQYCIECWLGVGPNDNCEIAWDEDVVTVEFERGDLSYWVVPGLVDHNKVRADLAILDEALNANDQLVLELGREYARVRDEARARADEVWQSLRELLPPVTGVLHANGRLKELERVRGLLEEHVTAALHEFRPKEFLAWWELFGALEFEVLSCTPEEGFDDWRLHDCIRERYPGLPDPHGT